VRSSFWASVSWASSERFCFSASFFFFSLSASCASSSSYCCFFSIFFFFEKYYPYLVGSKGLGLLLETVEVALELCNLDVVLGGNLLALLLLRLKVLQEFGLVCLEDLLELLELLKILLLGLLDSFEDLSVVVKLGLRK